MISLTMTSTTVSAQSVAQLRDEITELQVHIEQDGHDFEGAWTNWMLRGGGSCGFLDLRFTF